MSAEETRAFMARCDDDDDYAEARLSFCDFPLSTEEYDWNSSKEVYKINSPSDQDFFEFIASKDLFPDLYARDNIIFCGKLIPYKASKPDNAVARNPKMSRKSQNHKTSEPKKDDRVKPSRWYMLAFGLERYYMGKMDLSDMRARQTRRNSSMKRVTASQSHCVHGGGDEMCRTQSDGGKKRGNKGGLWGLIRLLGCKGLQQNANTVFTSSAGCIPQM